MNQYSRFSVFTLARRAAVVAAVLLVAATVSEAGPRRARMSRDLVERLASGQTGATSVIISGDERRIDAIAQRHGGRVKKALRGAAVVEFPGAQLEAVSQDPEVDHLSGDVPVRRLMAVTSEAIGADKVWSGAYAGVRGYTGRGIGVAVIDSGVAAHKSLRKRIVASVDFTGSGDGGDSFGHGTHVAGIIASDGDAAYTGVAPDAHIVSLKVLNGEGVGETSDVIEAIQWAIDHRAKYNLRVINLSLGHPVFESYRDDPICQVLQRAVDA